MQLSGQASLGSIPSTIRKKKTCKWPVVYEKMLNIIKHQRNADQKHNEITCHPS